MDEFVDQLLTEERVCDIILPRLAKRQVLEENGDTHRAQKKSVVGRSGRKERSITFSITPSQYTA